TFAAYGFANPTNIMSIHFNLGLNVDPSNTNANWYFFIGGTVLHRTIDRAATEYNLPINATDYAHDNRIFGVYRLIKSTESGVFSCTRMTQTSTVNSRDWANASTANLAANNTYAIDIYCNNSTDKQYYMRGTTAVELASYTYALYVNGDLKGTFAKTKISNGSELGSFAIMSRDAAQSGSGNYDNSASLTISNFKVVHLGDVSTTPVTLTDFKGNATNTGIALNWQTASEQNNSHFILSRSSNGKDFFYLTRVEGNGTSNNINNYSYTDKNPSAGTNYYQLEQVDKDGTKTVNKSLYVNYKSTDADFVVSRSSNNNLKITLNASRIEWSEIIITDIAGKVIYKGKHLLSEGKNEIEVPLSGSKQMVSVVYVQTATESKSAKLIL
ncbi:hypothetical protein, partial [Pseudopedobacter sp.]|uniref:hypothetical protein n=1 Tax=Pseudopedobacter sp. TaxID=1936787 RepID=UPI003340DBE4